MGALVGCMLGVTVMLGLNDGRKLDFGEGTKLLLGMMLGAGDGSRFG